VSHNHNVNKQNRAFLRLDFSCDDIIVRLKILNKKMLALKISMGLQTKGMIKKLTNAPATGFIQFETASLVFQVASLGKHPGAGNQIQEKSIRAKMLKIISLVVFMFGERM
jgi:hypothetical protein